MGAVEALVLSARMLWDGDEAAQGMDQAGKKAGGLQAKISSAMKKIGGAIAGALTVDAIKNFAVACVQAGAEVSAEAAAYEQIMGDYADAASDKLNSVAKETGMVNSRLTPYMTSMTAKFKGLGYGVEDATDLAVRGLNIAADSAAFWDMSLDESTSHLNSFINGSYEGGEAIGLFANDTQMAAYAVERGLISDTKAWANLDEATRQATRLEYAENMMAQSGAVGQAARESDQYANVTANLTEKWRQFKAQIGAPLIEKVVTPAVAMLSRGIDALSTAVTYVQEHFEDWQPYLVNAAEGLAILGAAVAGFKLGSMISSLAKWASGLSLATIKTKLMAAAQAALNFVMNLNPIGIVIGVIAALAAAFVIAYNKSETFRAFVGELWAAIGEKLQPVIQAVSEFITNTLVPALQALGEYIMGNVVPPLQEFGRWLQEYVLAAIQSVAAWIMDTLVPTFQAWGDYIMNNIVPALMALWSAIVEFVQPLFQAVVDGIMNLVANIDIYLEYIKSVITGALNIIKSAVMTAWNAISAFISGALNVIQAVIQTVTAVIKGDWSGAWEGIKAVVIAVWNLIKSFVSICIKGIWNVITTVLSSIANTMSAAWGAIKLTVITVWGVIRSFITTLWGRIRDTAVDIWEGIKSAIQTPILAVKSWLALTLTSIKIRVTSIFDGIKDKVTTIWEGIKSAIQTPIEAARDLVSGAIEAIKGFFNFEFTWPKLKMPHFSFSGSWNPFDWPDQFPSIGVEWYAKAMDNAMVLKQPTLFGASDGKFLGGGEAGNEVIAGEAHLMSLISAAVVQNNEQTQGLLAGILSVLQTLDAEIYDRIVDALADGLRFKLDGREFGRLVRTYA